MKIIKADNYQTWYIEYNDQSILIDPWLSNSLTPDGTFFIQRKKINKSCLSKEDIDKVKALIITAPFEDHLHVDTIKKLPHDLPIYTSSVVSKALIKNSINNPRIILTEEGTDICSINVKALPTSYPYFSTTFSILMRDSNGNRVFHEGHRVNFRYLSKENIKSDVAILTAEESKLFGFVELGMNYKKTIKACELMGSKKLFITGNKPNNTKGFIGNFIKTKGFNTERLSKNIEVFSNEGDIYKFNGE